jgi:hypothetical protein
MQERGIVSATFELIMALILFLCFTVNRYFTRYIHGTQWKLHVLVGLVLRRKPVVPSRIFQEASENYWH